MTVPDRWGGSPRPIQKFLTSSPDGINWIKIGDATASGKYIYKTKEKIIPAGVSRSRMVHEGDFLLSNSMSFGRPYVVRTSGCIHDGWLVLSDYASSMDQDYLYHVLGSQFLYRQFDRLAAGARFGTSTSSWRAVWTFPYRPLKSNARSPDSLMPSGGDRTSSFRIRAEAPCSRGAEAVTPAPSLLGLALTWHL